MMSSSIPNDVENLRLNKLIKRVNDCITSYVSNNRHLVFNSKTDRLKDADNRRWNIAKIKGILKNEEKLSRLKLASRILEHITSDFFTTGFLGRSALRDLILGALKDDAPEIFEFSPLGFSFQLPQNPVFNIQSDDQVGKIENDRVPDRELTFEDDVKQESNDLRELILALNKIFRDYIENNRHAGAYHDRRYNIQTMIDIVTIPEGNLAKFKYFTANEVALRIYEHISSILCLTFFGSTFRNELLALVQQHSSYFGNLNKLAKAHFLHETDKYHRFRVAMRIVTEYNESLKNKFDSTKKHFNDLVLNICPQYQSYISSLKNIITRLQKEKKDLIFKENSLSKELAEVREKLKIQRNYLDQYKNHIALLENDNPNGSKIADYFSEKLLVPEPLTLQNGTITPPWRCSVVSLIHDYEDDEERYSEKISLLNSRIAALELILDVYMEIQLDEEMELQEEQEEKEEKEISQPTSDSVVLHHPSVISHSIYRRGVFSGNTIELPKHIPPPSRATC